MFELRLREFSNPSARDMDGNCCVLNNHRSSSSTNLRSVSVLSGGGVTNSASNLVSGTNPDALVNSCGGICTTKFRVCVKHYQVTIDHNPPCTFGEAVTSEVFGDKIVAQEFKFPFNFRWPVSCLNSIVYTNYLGWSSIPLLIRLIRSCHVRNNTQIKFIRIL